jgi:hypothetical protein
MQPPAAGAGGGAFANNSSPRGSPGGGVKAWLHPSGESFCSSAEGRES